MPEVSAEAVVRNANALISAALLPGAVIGLPVGSLVLLPDTLHFNPLLRRALGIAASLLLALLLGLLRRPGLLLALLLGLRRPGLLLTLLLGLLLRRPDLLLALLLGLLLRRAGLLMGVLLWGVILLFARMVLNGKSKSSGSEKCRDN